MPDSDWIAQQLHLLLTAYGYNLYNSVNRARADDLLVRERASGYLGEAVNALTRLAADYTARCLPPSTREQPFPPPEKMVALRQIESLRNDISQLSSRIRGLSAPAQDRTWARFREEASTLHYLLSCDYFLITQSEAVLQYVQNLTAEGWTEAQAAEARALLQKVEQIAHDRERFLTQGVV